MQKKKYRLGGCIHEVVYDDNNFPIADRMYFKEHLVSEGIYEKGRLIGYRRYYNAKGHEHISVYNLRNQMLSDQEFDSKGLLVEKIYSDDALVSIKTRNLQTGEFRITYSNGKIPQKRG